MAQKLYRIIWDNIGPDYSLNEEEGGLSYQEALSYRRQLLRDIDVVDIKIKEDDMNSFDMQIHCEELGEEEYLRDLRAKEEMEEFMKEMELEMEKQFDEALEDMAKRIEEDLKWAK